MKIKFKIALLVLVCTIVASLSLGTTSFIISGNIISDDSDEIINGACERTVTSLDAYFVRVEQSVDMLASYALETMTDFSGFKSSSAAVDEYTEKFAHTLLAAAEHTEGAITAYIRYSPDVAYPTSGMFYMRDNVNADYYETECTDFSIYDKTDLNHVGWYYIPVNNGKPTWMEPYLNENIGVYMISYVVPLYVNGENLGIVGMDLDFTMVEELASLDVSYDDVDAFIVGNDKSSIMYHEDTEYGTQIADLDQNGGTAKIAELLRDGNDERVTVETNYGGTKYLATTRTMRNGMHLVTSVPYDEVDAGGKKLRIISGVTTLIVLIVAAAAAFLVGMIMTKKLEKLNAAAKRIAAGDLSVNLDVNSSDEIGELSNNFQKTVERLHDYVGYIDEVSIVLDEIGRGNLDFSLTRSYLGDFAKIKVSLENISKTLTRTMAEINSVAEQVALGSEQVSAGAQSLAQSSTEQTSSIQELSDSIDHLTTDVNKNNENIRGAFTAMETTFEEINESSRNMSDMLGAMNAISEASEEIKNIVKTVDDIAFQTNVLAINAAIEAARAGESGKGFAVVAEEIQMLASRTAASTGDINALVENVMGTVENGRSISEKADGSLKNVASTSEVVKNSLSEISASSDKQSESIELINVGIKQIADAVQNNSATAEQSAAASEEMSSQAQILKDRMNMFRFKK